MATMELDPSMSLNANIIYAKKLLRDWREIKKNYRLSEQDKKNVKRNIIMIEDFLKRKGVRI